MLTETQKYRIMEVVDAAMQQRGEIVNSYSQIEFLFADLIAKMRNHHAYEGTITGMPFRPESRISVLTRLLSMDGPLKRYHDDLAPLIEDFKQFEDDRHFLTHGFASASVSPESNIILEFRKFAPSKDNQWHISYRHYTPAKFKYLRESISEFSHRALLVFRRVYLELRLEETDVLNP
ncbi:MAG: hypothetical protein CMI63_01125 [Parvularcula sp.]|uniref:hypothetical protein n=2 Tax=Hyphococcus sp. TaxID=2038636 RepID=UPI000C4DBED5|nr:hypothetical protein [Parvularcula sp.]